MTTVYFIRHAEPDYTNHSDAERPLSYPLLRSNLWICRISADSASNAMDCEIYI